MTDREAARRSSSLVVALSRAAAATATPCRSSSARRCRPSRGSPRSIERGAKLAVDEINADGGVLIGGRHARSSSSSCSTTPPRPPPRWPTRARRSSRNAAVLLTDGTGATSVAAVTDPAKLPVFVLFEGGAGLIDPQPLSDAVPARPGRRDHDPPAGRLHRQRQAEGGDADRRLGLRRAGPQGAARVVHGRRGRGRLRPGDPAPRARPRAAGPRRAPRRRRPADRVGERRRRRRRARGRPPRRTGTSRSSRARPARTR